MRKGNSHCATLTAAALLTATLTGPVSADAGYSESSYWIEAPVLGVTPIATQRTVRHPVRQCTTRPHHYHDDRYGYERHRSEESYFVPGLLGGLVGGLIGNQFGGGSGKKALTIVGALAGSSIARDAARERRRASYPAEVCRTTYETEVVEDVTAYDVTYEYAGRSFNKRMDVHPGDTVRIRVALEPTLPGNG